MIRFAELGASLATWEVDFVFAVSTRDGVVDGCFFSAFEFDSG